MHWIVLFCFTASALGQQVGELQFRDFASTAGLGLVGSAETHGAALRLTPSREYQRGAVWANDRLLVREGFALAFRFRISEPQGLDNGADGFAFVIQNNGPTALAGHGGSGGFGFGNGENDPKVSGIANSLAVFFDTFRNSEDRTGNAISICTNGDPQGMRWPPPRLAVNWKPSVKLKDGAEHEVRIAFDPPLLSVFVDNKLAVRAPVDLARMVGPDGRAYVGFTAATGAGYENHDILDWRFRPHVSSAAFAVSSEIAFARFACLPKKGLCTPEAGIVEALDSGGFHVVLPAHLPWGAEIPNPQGRRVHIRNPKGAVCWEPASGGCGVLTDGDRREGVRGGLRVRSEKGRTFFGIEDHEFTNNEGYFEFDVELEP